MFHIQTFDYLMHASTHTYEYRLDQMNKIKQLDGTIEQTKVNKGFHFRYRNAYVEKKMFGQNTYGFRLV